MGHGKSTFKQADLTRALRAVEKAGRDVVRAEIARDGRIVSFGGATYLASPLGPRHVVLSVAARSLNLQTCRGCSRLTTCRPGPDERAPLVTQRMEGIPDQLIDINATQLTAFQVRMWAGALR